MTYLTRLKDSFSSVTVSRSLPALNVDEAAAQLAQRCGGQGGKVDLLLKAGGEQGLTDQTVLRFLNAEKFSVEKAEARLRAYARWRAETCPFRSIKEAEVPNALASGTTYLSSGRDVEGRPLLVIKAAKHFSDKRDLEEAKRFACYVLDTLVAFIQDGSDGKLQIIVDLRGIGYANLDAPMLRCCLAVLQTYYPERTRHLWFYDAPTIFWGCWKLVSPFVDQVTREKIKFVSSGDSSSAQLLSLFSKEDLPAEFGGMAELRPLEQHGLPPLPTHMANGDINAAQKHHITLPEVVAVPVASDCLN